MIATCPKGNDGLLIKILEAVPNAACAKGALRSAPFWVKTASDAELPTMVIIIAEGPWQTSPKNTHRRSGGYRSTNTKTVLIRPFLKE